VIYLSRPKYETIFIKHRQPHTNARQPQTRRTTTGATARVAHTGRTMELAVGAYCPCARLTASGDASRLILQATNTKQVALIVVAVVGVLAVVAHEPAVGVVAIELAGTPPVAVEADTVETAIGTVVAARQGGKVIGVLAQVGFARAGRTAISPAILCLQILASGWTDVRAIGAACAVRRAVQGIPLRVAGDMPA